MNMDTNTITIMLQTSQQLTQISAHLNSISTQLAENKQSTANHIAADISGVSEQILHTAQHVSRQQEKLKDLQALADIGQIVNSSLDLTEVLRIVMDTIVRLTGAERGFLMLRDESNELQMRVARNWEQESIRDVDFKISRTVIDRVVEEGLPIVTTNAQEDPRFGGQDSIIAYNLRSLL